MKKILPIFIIGFFVWVSVAQAGIVDGRILLQVEEHGEAWYVNPTTARRYFLGRPFDAFEVMRKSGIGITNINLNKIPVAIDHLGTFGLEDSDNDGYSNMLELKNGFDPFGAGSLGLDYVFTNHQKGKIFLQAEENGEAWYVNPVDAMRYFLGRPADAFEIMRKLGLGITNADLEKIVVGNIDNIENENKEFVALEKTIFIADVPFVPQAPFGDWADVRQEDGCEEISAIMAVHWARGQGLTRQEALDELIAITVYEEENYGNYNDTSAYDTSKRIFREYFKYNNIEYQEDINKKDIIKALEAGNVIVVPIDGTIIGNPYYTQPGPPRHMLVIKGYDSNRDVFITNDPGTRRGENYEYKTDKIFSAIRDYPTGVHNDPGDIYRKVIIIVKKESR